MFRDGSTLGGSIAKTPYNRIAALAPVFLLHAAALILLVVTERSLIGAGIFLLVWIMLNCLGLALVRRPAIVALISLEILLTLTLLSRFKFDKLWMTVDFIDAMIIDRDTTAFLLAVFPSLRWWIALAAVAESLSQPYRTACRRSASRPPTKVDPGAGYPKWTSTKRRSHSPRHRTQEVTCPFAIQSAGPLGRYLPVYRECRAAKSSAMISRRRDRANYQSLRDRSRTKLQRVVHVEILRIRGAPKRGLSFKWGRQR
jgi:hypothetical protein